MNRKLKNISIIFGLFVLLMSCAKKKEYEAYLEQGYWKVVAESPDGVNILESDQGSGYYKFQEDGTHLYFVGSDSTDTLETVWVVKSSGWLLFSPSSPGYITFNEDGSEFDFRTKKKSAGFITYRRFN